MSVGHFEKNGFHSTRKRRVMKECAAFTHQEKWESQVRCESTKSTFRGSDSVNPPMKRKLKPVLKLSASELKGGKEGSNLKAEMSTILETISSFPLMQAQCTDI
ncbi:hypothetical protein TNIN_426971 [Trichonephila inaurata madagascariensis]|uniref:Uncharacterized protein n=1 Tax=Trichonephila inaurata madagascariensis TaxID=2747483 RepID=A0A8X6IIE2_9ARAC|nr:hypothetical protein TNIN_426971 [Trichonephila inaurata madagascariensis]